ncbi:SSS family solute:Na+ symporter [Acetoanaerobium pronyense]|uniref:SSS family solute:Na+ symporter n=1 Tax=Acetoanaerobium pronyense TaxID=1482736 RepID=A0ABS4KK56_9FIRM|nr:sodium:solute symporter family protein [Acetoanaerobium pronyense]MBP2027720.1 SSS family solute:Na+ symporter [Acetoanaerobium pronyense]
MENQAYLISTVLTLVIVSFLGIRSNKKVKSSSDFVLGGRKSSSFNVSAIIVGTLVGGASTIGTAQAAYVSGFNGMWFTLGANLGCIFLGTFLVKPLRDAEISTIPEFIERYYGFKAKIASSLISSVAIFVHITGQILSSVAIFTSLFSIGENLSVVVTMILIISYIFFGGFLGSSIVGNIKTILLYLTLILSSIIVLQRFSGIVGFIDYFPFEPWFNIFSDGIFSGLGQGFSLVVGVCSTQTYLQAIFSGKTYKESVKGAYIAALLIPPIGLMSTIIGMFMRVNHPFIDSKQALPLFILEYLNPLIGGIVIGTLIISVVATGAGLTLGISTMFSRDIYSSIINKNPNDKSQMLSIRVSVIGVLALTTLMVFLNMDSLILKWAFLSMALRGTVIFIPLLGIIILKDKVPKKAGLYSMTISPLLAIVFGVFGFVNIDPLYIGMGSSFIIITLFYITSFNK